MAERALFLGSAVIASLRREIAASKYVPVAAIANAADLPGSGVVDLRGLINRVANADLVAD